MITKTYDSNTNIYTFTFTGRHIYAYIHYLIDTSKQLSIVNELLNDYKDKCKLEIYYDMIKDCKNIVIIKHAIDAMMNRQKIIHNENCQNSHSNMRLSWLNSLFLNQDGTQLRPSIEIEEAIDNED